MGALPSDVKSFSLIHIYIPIYIRMVYINSSGSLQKKQSVFRLSIVPELFWAILNFFGLFFSSLFGSADTGATRGGRYVPRSRRGGGGGGGGGRPGYPGETPRGPGHRGGTSRIGRVDLNSNTGGS